MYYKIINAKLGELDISVYKLSKNCQIPYSTLLTNLSGKCEFSVKNLKKVCAYLGIGTEL
jgi:predicted transcriptional regulator